MKRIMKYVGLVLVSLFFVVGGQAHFTATEFFVKIVPPYVPLPVLMVYVTGVLELIGAIAIWVPAWRSWAGIGLVALTVCVTPANVYMWMNPELFPEVPPSVLGWRLVAQVVLIAIIWWSTRPDSEPMSAAITEKSQSTAA
jgi:uncharacterized membrane protein